MFRGEGLESREDSVGRDLVAQSHGEPVLQEQIDPGSVESSLGDLICATILRRKSCQYCLAPGVDVRADLLALLEDGVLDEVRRKQRGAAIVRALRRSADRHRLAAS